MTGLEALSKLMACLSVKIIQESFHCTCDDCIICWKRIIEAEMKKDSM